MTWSELVYSNEILMKQSTTKSRIIIETDEWRFAIKKMKKTTELTIKVNTVLTEILSTNII